VSKTGVIAIDLGGVLLRDGTVAAQSACEALGIPPDVYRQRWHDMRPFVDTGQLYGSSLWRSLALPYADPDAVETAVLDAFTELNYGVISLREYARCHRLILATNHVTDWIEIWKARFPWFSLFSGIFNSADVGVRKPDLAFFMQLRGRFSPSVMIDDHPANLTAAAQAGMQTVLATGMWYNAVLDALEHTERKQSA